MWSSPRSEAELPGSSCYGRDGAGSDYHDVEAPAPTNDAAPTSSTVHLTILIRLEVSMRHVDRRSLGRRL